MALATPLLRPWYWAVWVGQYRYAAGGEAKNLCCVCLKVKVAKQAIVYLSYAIVWQYESPLSDL